MASNYTGARLNMIYNYVYLYHTDTLIIVPEYADSIQDQLQTNYQSTTVLSRTAPIYSFSDAGPRTIQVAFQLHRDLMNDINEYNTYSAAENADWVDTLIKNLQSAALPSYQSASKLVNPPLVALRLGSDIFIKGIIQGGVGITYKYPIIPGVHTDGTADNTLQRYSNVDVAFSITEVEPYDAETVARVGSYRGLSTTLERNIYTKMQG